ncbi:hypothetical protein GEMRC1_003917 [Eukaryota sp. GEM-RC1]
MSNAQFTVKESLKENITDLEGFSQQQWDEHWKLYNGYVSNANELNSELHQARQQKREDKFVQDRRRMLSFELSGIYLHEIFFGLIKNGGTPMSTEFKNILAKHFGSVEQLHAEMMNCAKTRGVGWSCLYYDKERDHMFVGRVELHQNGHPAGLPIVMALDNWEHGYIIDCGAGPSGLAKFLELVHPHINWKAIEDRYNTLV